MAKIMQDNTHPINRFDVFFKYGRKLSNQTQYTNRSFVPKHIEMFNHLMNKKFSCSIDTERNAWPYVWFYVNIFMQQSLSFIWICINLYSFIPNKVLGISNFILNTVFSSTINISSLIHFRMKWKMRRRIMTKTKATIGYQRVIGNTMGRKRLVEI